MSRFASPETVTSCSSYSNSSQLHQNRSVIQQFQQHVTVPMELNVIQQSQQHVTMPLEWSRHLAVTATRHSVIGIVASLTEIATLHNVFGMITSLCSYSNKAQCHWNSKSLNSFSNKLQCHLKLLRLVYCQATFQITMLQCALVYPWISVSFHLSPTDEQMVTHTQNVVVNDNSGFQHTDTDLYTDTDRQTHNRPPPLLFHPPHTSKQQQKLHVLANPILLAMLPSIQTSRDRRQHINYADSSTADRRSNKYSLGRNNWPRLVRQCRATFRRQPLTNET